MLSSDTKADRPQDGQPETNRSKPQRSGAFMSNKQIAKAATHGRLVTFQFLSTNPAHEVTGYVVGMDDYHWMVASVLPEDLRSEDEVLALSLVHKSRVDMVRLASRGTLDQEEVTVQLALDAIGGSFWAGLDRRYNGRS